MLVNGKETDLAKNMSLKEFIDGFGYELPKVAVEKNGVIIPRCDFASEMICNDDSLEIVFFVGGG